MRRIKTKIIRVDQVTQVARNDFLDPINHTAELEFGIQVFTDENPPRQSLDELPECELMGFLI